MENISGSAKVIDLHRIEMYYDYFNKEDLLIVKLYENGKFLENLQLDNMLVSHDGKSCICSYKFSKEIKIGKEYTIYDKLNRIYNLDITYFAGLDSFEKRYRYRGQLGSIYSKEKTEFKVFSPLASQMYVKIYYTDLNKTTKVIKMDRQVNGVFQTIVEGDLEGLKYVYLVKINGQFFQVVDPYAYSVDTNSRHGYIVDINKIKNLETYKENLPSKLEGNYIYELSVRDMTSLYYSSEAGTFNLLSKSNLKYKGKPIGIDYIANLGVSHVQIMPVFDFQTVNDSFPRESYNWGYDPKFYFAIEGSFSSDPENCYTRMIEFKNLVSSFHKKGIRVNMDVVFNHVFDARYNSLNILCPNYCFRKDSQGHLSNATGCGNELETRKFMIRKFVLDNISFFMDVYSIDGFRFDLMGLIDLTSMQQVEKLIHKKDKLAMVYGEGWDMQSVLPSNERSSMKNASQLKNIGFFNDRFRDITRGSNYNDNLFCKGYLSGDINYIEGFKHVFAGCVEPIAFPPLFDDASQSINYVECHDDNCLFDKLITINSNLMEVLSTQNLINTISILACGNCFIHMGQEFGQTKKGIRNSYNAGDQINGFDFEMMVERYFLVENVKNVIEIKKRYYDLFNLNNRSQIENAVSFENIENGCLKIKYSKNKEVKLVIYINPTILHTTHLGLDGCNRVLYDDCKVDFDLKKSVSSAKIHPLSALILVK